MTLVSPTYDAEDVAATSLRTTMLGISAITDIVAAAKIHWLGIETDDVKMPYISIDYMVGGWEKSEPRVHSADVVMKMCMYTTDKAMADSFSKAIRLLHRVVMDVSDFTDVVPTATIYEKSKIRGVDKGQNIPVYSIGGYYCLRFVVN